MGQNMNRYWLLKKRVGTQIDTFCWRNGSEYELIHSVEEMGQNMNWYMLLKTKIWINNYVVTRIMNPFVHNTGYTIPHNRCTTMSPVLCTNGIMILVTMWSITRCTATSALWCLQYCVQCHGIVQWQHVVSIWLLSYRRRIRLEV